MEGAPGSDLTAPSSGSPPDRLSSATIARLKSAAALLRKAEKPVRILRAVAWGPEVAERFFAHGARELPDVSYTPLDAAPVHEMLAAARALVDGSGPV